MKIIKEESGLYIATHKLPNGFEVRGSGYTVENALAWALWGVKSYYSRIAKEARRPVKGFMSLFARV